VLPQLVHQRRGERCEVLPHDRAGLVVLEEPGRVANDPGHRWFRDVLRRAAASVDTA